MGDWNSEKESGGECKAKSAIVVKVEGGCGWNGACTCQSKGASESTE